MKARVLFVVILALLAAACAGQFSVEQRDPLTFTRPPPSEKPRNISVIYVHGISCHDPGYSTPFQFRLAERMGLRRDESQAIDGKAYVDFVEFYDDSGMHRARTSDWDFSQFNRRWKVYDPDPSDWLKGSAAFDDASARKARFDRLREAAKRKTWPADPKADLAAPVSNFFTFSNVCVTRDRQADKPVNANLGSGVLIRRFMRGQDRVTFYEVLWSPASEGWKKQNLQYDFEHGSEVARGPNLSRLSDRALANLKIKDIVLNGGIPDAVFYAGVGRNEVKRVVKSGICIATLYDPTKLPDWKREQTLNPECRKQTAVSDWTVPQTIYFSESLGSRVLLDSLSELSFALDPFDGTRVLKRTPVIDGLVEHPFFMFANQLPMLEISSPDYTNPLDTAIAPFWAAQDQAQRLSKEPEQTAVKSCFTRAGESYGRLNESKQPAAQALAALRGPMGAADTDAALAALVQRREILEGHLGEIRACAIAAARTNEGVINQWASQQVFRRLRNPGPSGLDMYLERRALDLVLLRREVLRGSDAAAKAALWRDVDALMLHVYAFSDANDVLTWEVSDEFKRRFTMVRFANVQARIANPALPFRGAAGLLVDPSRAHMNYRFSDQTLNLVMCILGEEDAVAVDCKRVLEFR